VSISSIKFLFLSFYQASSTFFFGVQVKAAKRFHVTVIHTTSHSLGKPRLRSYLDAESSSHKDLVMTTIRSGHAPFVRHTTVRRASTGRYSTISAQV